MTNIQNSLRKICKKPLWALAVVVALVLVVGMILFGRALYFYNDPLADPTFGFQYLQPTKLPDDLKLTAKRIVVGGEWRSSDRHDNLFNFVLGFFMPVLPQSVTAEMNFRTQDWMYSIQERRHANESIATTLKNFDPTSVGITCTERIIAQDKSYRLCHWIDYGTISVYETEFIQSGTFVHAELPTSLTKTLTMSELDTFVDSFVVGSPSGIQVIHSVVG